jgi:hypothetical protein
MPTALLLAWWNLIYLLPLLLALLYLVVYAASGLTFGDADVAADGDAHADVEADADVDAHADVEAHADVDADADVDGDVDAHADVDADADADADTDADHDADAHHPAASHGGSPHDADGAALLKALSWFGVGRVPLSIVLMLLFVSWGAIGFAANYTVWAAAGWETAALLVSLPVAGLVSSLFTRTSVRTIGRWMPSTETSAEPRAKLVGRSAEALYSIDERFGLAAVRSRHGDLYHVPCRVYAGRKGVEKGRQVLLVDYDPQQEFFYVTEDDLNP